jgi:hypothetical protein
MTAEDLVELLEERPFTPLRRSTLLMGEYAKFAIQKWHLFLNRILRLECRVMTSQR